MHCFVQLLSSKWRRPRSRWLGRLVFIIRPIATTNYYWPALKLVFLLNLLFTFNFTTTIWIDPGITIDPNVYKDETLLWDVAKLLYETLESQQVIKVPFSTTTQLVYGRAEEEGFRKAIYHATLGLSRLLERIARNVARHPHEIEHQDLLLSMFA